MAVAAPAGRAHRDEHRFGARHGGFQIGGEGQAPGLGIGRHHIVQARLKDGNAAGLQGLDLAGILVDADHVMAEFRQAGAGHQADIARADHRDAHGISEKMLPVSGPKGLKYKGNAKGSLNCPFGDNGL